MLYFIVNGVSGKGNGETTAKNISNILVDEGVEFEMVYTKAPRHAEKLAQKLSEKEDCTGIVAVGGDGTFSEVLNGIDTKIPLGLISSGSGNDFMRTFNKGASLDEQLKPILAGDTKEIDFLTVNDRRCLNVVGTGFDVDILIREHKMRKIFKGSFSYYLSLVVTLFTIKFRNFKMKIDDKIKINEPCLLCAMANGRYFGGGMPISLDSAIDDGVMELTVVKKVPFYAIPNLLLKFMKGKLKDVTKYVSVYSCKKVECEVTPKVDIQIDGELLDIPKFKTSLIKGGLRVFG